MILHSIRLRLRRTRGDLLGVTIGAAMTLLGGGQLASAVPCPAPDEIHVGSVDKPYTQERKLNGVDKPLKSSGRVKVAEGEIHWHMLSPFDVDTIITPQGISQSVNGGSPQPAGVTAGLGPQLAKLFGDLLQGQWAELKSSFTVTKKPGQPGGPWAVSLGTLDPILKKVVSQIIVQGCTDITKIEIDHPNGDHEEITLGGSPN